jgi:DNA-binding NtrC family response regulator
MGRILVLDKRGETLGFVKQLARREDLLVEAVSSRKAAREQLQRLPYDLVLWDTDLASKEISKEVRSLKQLSGSRPDVPIIVVTGADDPVLAAVHDESFQWIQRPVKTEELAALVDVALRRERPPGDKLELDPDVRVPIEFEGILAISLPMRSVIQRILEAAAADIPVLITGETGTGKDLVAAAIHKRSGRKDGPLLAVNTGAIASELIASELFGHEKGAFTGADEARAGIFEQAKGGTVFLDEITTMDEKTQVSLLRVLETKTIRRVRGLRDIETDVRIIAASNEDVEEAVKLKRFREDLYYRLDVFRIHLPRLRDRPGGVSLLTDHFVSRFDAAYKKNIRAVSRTTYALLRRYPWPGNVRELKNVIQRAVLMAKGAELTPDLLPERIRETSETDGRNAVIQSPIQLGMSLAEVEKQFIQMTLSSVGGNKMKAASILKISRRALYNKLKKHGFL